MTLAYLATPFTRRPDHAAAAAEAARLCARLRVAEVFVYSPIVHCYEMAKHGGLDPLDLTIWYPHNELMMGKCDVLIVACMEGWDQSDGIAMEIDFFARQAKPIFGLDPNSLTMTMWESAA